MFSRSLINNYTRTDRQVDTRRQVEIDRESVWETDRQTRRQVEIDRQTDRQTRRHTQTGRNRHLDTPTDRQVEIDREKFWERDRQTRRNRQTDRQTQRHTQTGRNRHLDTQTDSAWTSNDWLTTRLTDIKTSDIALAFNQLTNNFSRSWTNSRDGQDRYRQKDW